ncbi:MAG TPA: shikimate dehydrogenase [Candidatus Limnocylindrales bacterium]|nr:shikimate dehydrogenase [Candidatus Limnocylindrales bacterium]
MRGRRSSAAPARRPAPARASVEGTTRVVGILGDPVDHSLSPRMHNAAYAELGLDFVYVPFRASSRGLRDAVRAMKTLGIVGFNVTVPYKEAVVRLVDRLTDTASAIGAVNTVYREGDDIVGDNTDAEGFHRALLAHDFRSRAKRALVIGAGGSARAIVHALLAHDAAEIVLANRTVAKARKLARHFESGRRLRAAGLEVLGDADFLASRHLVINCTPVGLHGGSFLPYRPEKTSAGCVHFDLAYGGTLTPFLRLAHQARRPVIDGRHMLVHQGAIAFRRFTGRTAPVGVMLAAVGVPPLV